MESAIVETTNDTSVSDIQMEQWNAEINVGMAMLNCMEKYAMLAEYATCDIDEFFEEGKLDDKIASVDEWKNSGGKVKKIIGTIGSGILKGLRAIANFFKDLFSKDKNPFARAKRLIQKMKFNSKKSLRAQLAEAREDIKGLRSDLQEEMKENKETNDKLNKVTKERDYLEKQNNKNQRIAQDYIGKVMDLTKELDALKAKNIDLVATVDKLGNALKRAESAEADNAKFINEIQKLTDDWAVAAAELDEAQKENAELKAKNRNLEMTVEAANAKLTQYETQSGDLSEKVNAIIPALESYFAKVDDGKISVDKRTKSFKTIKEFYGFMLKLKAAFSKL
jgi:DNA repair exonuclease SbcCD ATPase subunit